MRELESGLTCAREHAGSIQPRRLVHKPCHAEEDPIVTYKSAPRRRRAPSAGIRQDALRPPCALLGGLRSRLPTSEPPPSVPASARQPLCSLLITLRRCRRYPTHPRPSARTCSGLGHGLNTMDREVQSHQGASRAARIIALRNYPARPTDVSLFSPLIKMPAIHA